MNLRQKTLLVIGGTFVGLVLVLYLASHLILLQGFAEQAERESAVQVCNGIVHILEQFQQEFGDRFRDWSSWNDAYEFVLDHNDAFQKSNLNPETFESLRVDLMVFVNTAGQVVHGAGYDAVGKRGTPLPASLARHLVAGSPLLRPAGNLKIVTGLLLLDEAPLLVTAHPILTSERKGPCRGVLIVGRYLDTAEVERLHVLAHLPLRILRTDRPLDSPDFRAALADLTAGQTTVTRPLDDDFIAGYILAADVYGEPALVLRVTAPRTIRQQGRIAMLYLLAALVFIGIVVAGVSILLLDRIFIQRLTRLSEAVSEIGDGGDISIRLPVAGSDELARLTEGMNGMLEALRRSHERLEQRVRERTARLSESNRLLQSEIAERQEAERRLADEKERLAVTLRCIGDGVIATDVAGTVVLMNAVAEALTGWSHDEGVGQPLDRILHLIHETTRRPLDNPANRALAQGEASTLPTPALLIARDGTERVIADSCAPIRQRDGAVLGAVVVFRDVTDRRRMEAELLKAGRLESIGILAGGIAHDFNNILVGIIGNISMAKRLGSGNAPLEGRLEEAERASLRARDLTQQLLTFSRGGAPVKKSTAIGELLREWSGFVTRGSKVRCEFEIPPDLWPVDIDAGQISQVVDNLVINAIQAMPDGGVVTVRAANEPVEGGRLFPHPDGRYVRVSVVDRGPGIPKDQLSKIFDPFYTTKPKGTGLGLTTSYSILSRHEGHIEVESSVESGTAFHIFLPASKQPEAPRPEAPAPAHRGRGRVLVMDDEEIVRQVLGHMLRGMGYETEMARDGAEAVTQFHRAREEGRPFDVVIMDLTVPGGLGGKETIQQLRALDPAVKAIVSSGYCQDPVMADFRSHGFCAFLAKPYKNEDLSRILESVLADEGP